MTERPYSKDCTCCAGRKMLPMARAGTDGPHPLWLCLYCDMGAAAAGPPILMSYLRKGHQ